MHAPTHASSFSHTIMHTHTAALLSPTGQAAFHASVRRGGVSPCVRPHVWRRLLFPPHPPSHSPSPRRPSVSDSHQQQQQHEEEEEGEEQGGSSAAFIRAYPMLVARAEEQVRLYAKMGRVRKNPGQSGVFGVTIPSSLQEEEGEEGGGIGLPSSSSRHGHGGGMGESRNRRSNWVAEIEADVQRTYVVVKGGIGEGEVEGPSALLLASSSSAACGGGEEEEAAGLASAAADSCDSGCGGPAEQGKEEEEMVRTCVELRRCLSLCLPPIERVLTDMYIRKAPLAISPYGRLTQYTPTIVSRQEKEGLPPSRRRHQQRPQPRQSSSASACG